MGTLLLLESQVSPEDIAEIETINIKNDMIVSPYDDKILDRYNVVSYLMQRHIHDQEIYAILDSNITYELAAIAESKSVDTIYSKNTISLLAFLHLAEVDIEPGISMAEYNITSKTPSFNHKLHSLRILDNLPAKYIVDIVLGRGNRIDLTKSSYKKRISEIQGVKEVEDISHWRMYYTFSMKIYLLANSPGTKFQKIETFLLWMWKEFLFSAVAFTFLAIFFSEKYGKMLKGVFSKNSSKIWNGIRNSTWDLTVISYWSDKVVKREDGSPHYILCSADVGLKETAAMILDRATCISKEKRFSDLFGSYLSKQEVINLIELSNTLESKLDDPARNIVKENFSYQYFSSCVENLEKQMAEKIKFTGS